MHSAALEHEEYPIFSFFVTHVERVTPPERGWSRIDGLLAEGRGKQTEQELNVEWIKLSEQLLVTNQQWLWQTPNGSIWIADKDDPFADQDKQLLMLGHGPDTFTEEALLLYGEELRSYFNEHILGV